MNKTSHTPIATFCDLKWVFSIIIFGELFAIILTISNHGFSQQAWNYLALSSLYIHWNSIISLIVLCVLKALSGGSGTTKIKAVFLFIGWVLLLFVFSSISFMTYYILNYFQLFELFGRFDLHHFILKNTLIGAIISGFILRYYYIQQQWKYNIQSEAETKIKLLHARIRPHFLFNSMNTIASLCVSNPFLAEKTTEDLAELFRPLISEDKQLTTWEKELELTQKYVNIEALRFSDRLKVFWHIDSIPQNAIIPVLTLQPLLENSIRYGIEPSIKGGSIFVNGKLHEKISGKNIEITIENSITRDHSQNNNIKNKNNQYIEQITDHQSSNEHGNQIAIDNIQQRLQAHFKNNASITATIQDRKFIVTLTFPYQQLEIQA
ncbi:MAG: histidine kinase [Gammaproteobacteria bacterium]|nr:histidine kinase [Gammaproteobacteria bacterium]